LLRKLGQDDLHNAAGSNPVTIRQGSHESKRLYSKDWISNFKGHEYCHHGCRLSNEGRSISRITCGITSQPLVPLFYFNRAPRI
jgi:hypothetical protein